MIPAKNAYRNALNLRLSALILAGICALAPTQAFSGTPESETIAATATQAGQAMNITLTLDASSTSSDLLVLSQAFQRGQDQALVSALSKTKAVGHCSIQGAANYDVAFIQEVKTPAGRSITFITSRPLQIGETSAGPSSESFDMAVGQFDLNDADPSKSTGFLFPSIRLAADPQGVFHYDLGGTSWSLAAVQVSRPTTVATAQTTLAEAPQK